MLTVWLLLAASMTVVAVIGMLILPKGGAAPGPGGAMALESLTSVISPKQMAPARPWRFIIIHHATNPPAAPRPAKPGAEATAETPSSSHFIIGSGRSGGLTDGQIIATPRWTDQLDGAHTRVPGHLEFNTEAIGICLLGDFDRQKPTAFQMTSLERLILALQDRYNIPLERVLAHSDVDSKVRCPGLLFPMEPLLRELRQAHLERLTKSLTSDTP